MGIFNRSKSNKSDETVADLSVEKKSEPKVKETKASEPAVKKAEKSADKASNKSDKIKGTTQNAYKILIKPLVTERASALGALNKYVFAINPAMNKIEVKKAIRAVYNVNPTKVNISNFSGRAVHYGRISGRTKSWKKAIVTLKAGDKIEIYEGV